MILTWIKTSFSKKIFSNVQQNIASNLCSYVQGQSPEPKVREYFYYIDHQGMLFLDDTRIKNFTSCFKDKKFLAFFFKRLRINNTERYKEFPYLSLCGPERNFVRCEDLPIVFTEILQKESKENGEILDYLTYNHADVLLTIPFQPNKILMDIKTGRVYHPGPDKTGGIGLVKSSLAIKLSSLFNFEHGEDKEPTKFNWSGTEYKIDSEWYNKLPK